eukprot:CAMPEP_0180511654 /NCGR_PEP_ID=MMETSP1036_2-20121128/51142_1 /TAXON_ID=632150 /ORGANISM="Azadinium spinosum, Strain 3D9" /LENGTH=99 /DNA_ID=CAMNT_0022522685 /DNA_START=363 /DNA_END=662 /DNA_ORIENTATION=+
MCLHSHEKLFGSATLRQLFLPVKAAREAEATLGLIDKAMEDVIIEESSMLFGPVVELPHERLRHAPIGGDTILPSEAVTGRPPEVDAQILEATPALSRV